MDKTPVRASAEMTLSLLASLFFLFALSGKAYSLDHHIPGMISKLNQVRQVPEKLELAKRAGKQRITLCKYCHGEDGMSVRSNIPNLAGQSAQYLVTQFELFASGERKDYVMEQLAGNLTEEERINIALYYSSLNPTRASMKPKTSQLTNHTPDPKLVNPKLVKLGQRLYQNECILCHGLNGGGGDTIPNIANQPTPYLTNTLMSFKNGDNKRGKSPMTSIMKNKEPQDIAALAAYLSHLPNIDNNKTLGN